MLTDRFLAPIWGVLLCAPAAVALAGCAADEDHDFDPAFVDQEVAVAGRWTIPASVRAVAQTQFVAYDSPPPWTGPGACAKDFQPGAKILADYVLREFPVVSHYWGRDCRTNTANPSQMSVHGTGRAIDIMIPTSGGAADNTGADPIANWLIMNAERIGIQLVIWDQSVWQASLSGEKLRAYGGPIPHVDHIHAEVTVEAANKQTAWFKDGGPSQPPNGRPEPPKEWYVLMGDWDGNGTRTPGMFHIPTHRWILSNHNSGGGVAADFRWGGGDNNVPVVGDWNGDGKDSPGLYNMASHVWTLSNVNAAHGVDLQFGWGGGLQVPVVGDWNGDGKDTPGLYNPVNHMWTLSNRNASNGEDYKFGWGGGNDIPVVGDWNGDGTDTPGLYNPKTHTWGLSNRNASNGVDYKFSWGGGDALPIVGDWNGDGTDTVGLFTDKNRMFGLTNFNAASGVSAQFGWGPVGVYTVAGSF
jgi:hypothetical protein